MPGRVAMQTCFSCGISLEDDDVYEVKGKIFVMIVPWVNIR